MLARTDPLRDIIINLLPQRGNKFMVTIQSTLTWRDCMKHLLGSPCFRDRPRGLEESQRRKRDRRKMS